MISILRRGTPLLVNEFLWSSGMAVLLQCYSVRGLDVVAACNIATTVSNLFKVVFLSMGNAVAIMVGQALGANDIERAKNCTWRLMTLSVGSNLIMATLLVLFAPAIPNIYNTEPHVRQIATQLIYVVAVMMPAYSFSHCCYFTRVRAARRSSRFCLTACLHGASTCLQHGCWLIRRDWGLCRCISACRPWRWSKSWSDLCWSRRACGFITSLRLWRRRKNLPDKTQNERKQGAANGRIPASFAYYSDSSFSISSACLASE